MKTSKPLSTISYNTPKFLIYTLERLRKAKIITKWYAMPHSPEDDEAGSKYHFHVYIESFNKVDPDALGAEFLELDPTKGKPRKCMPFRFSQFSDWFYYALHDPAYLASKGQSRRYRYDVNDMLAYDCEVLMYDKKCINMTDLTPYRKMLGFVERRQSFEEFVASGAVPIPQINAWQRAFAIMKYNFTLRGGRVGHDYMIDSETGEVVEQEVPDMKSPFFAQIGDHLKDWLVKYWKEDSDDDSNP